MWFHPLHQTVPMLAAKKNEGETWDALSLDKGNHFKELVECPKTAGHENEADAVFDETNFPGKKVMEMDGDVCKTVSFLFVRQFDVQPHGFTFGQGCAFIGSFHNARPAAGDDGEVVFGQSARQLDCRSIIFVGWGHASGTENG